MMWTHDLSPIIFSIGSVAFRWYGLMYALGFIAGYFFVRHAVRAKRFLITEERIDALLFAMFAGVILGGRLGYFLLYSPDTFLTQPAQLLRVWEGGMSFHGGLIGVVLVLLILARRWRLSVLTLADTILAPVALGLFFGRMGNFINGELPGRPTDGSWGVIFPQTDNLPRHPSQLYEAAYSLGLWGVLLGLWRLHARPGVIAYAFLALYGASRMIIEEFFRQPLDGFIGPLTRGAAYSLPMVVVGVIGLAWLYRVEVRRTVTRRG